MAKKLKMFEFFNDNGYLASLFAYDKKDAIKIFTAYRKKHPKWYKENGNYWSKLQCNSMWPTDGEKRGMCKSRIDGEWIYPHQIKW